LFLIAFSVYNAYALTVYAPGMCWYNGSSVVWELSCSDSGRGGRRGGGGGQSCSHISVARGDFKFVPKGAMFLGEGTELAAGDHGDQDVKPSQMRAYDPGPNSKDSTNKCDVINTWTCTGEANAVTAGKPANCAGSAPTDGTTSGTTCSAAKPCPTRQFW